METKLSLPNICSPARCLLSDTDEEDLGAAQKILVVCFKKNYTKKAIDIFWKKPDPTKYMSLASYVHWIACTKILSQSLPIMRFIL